jgi:hypothetical protein
VIVSSLPSWYGPPHVQDHANTTALTFRSPLPARFRRIDVSYRELNMVSDNLPAIIPQPRKASPDLEVLRRIEILGQPALPAVALLPDVLS